VDALNVAYWAGAPASLRLPLALLETLLKRGHVTTLFFDASARHHFAAEAESYAALLAQRPDCIEVPAGRSTDALLLREARRCQALIASRDHFRAHRRRYRKLIDEPGRRCEGFVADDALHLPALALTATLASTAATALQALPQRTSP
jgi:hypothetical protein